MAVLFNGAGVTACMGVTICLRSALVGISRYYSDLGLAGKQHWLRMLQAYVNV
jgi:hypothetical protein